MTVHWVTDLSFLIDTLERIHAEQPENMFYERLNLARLGAFGHSAGGSAVGQLCLADPRVRAGINWDGTQWGSAIDTVFTQPFMMMAFNPNPLIYRNGSRTVFYDLTTKAPSTAILAIFRT